MSEFVPKLDLFPWQKEALQNWMKTRSGIIEAAPGSGKTFLALELMEQRKSCKFLVIVPTNALAVQWKTKINAMTDRRCSSLDPNYMNTQITVVVEVVNSVLRRSDLLSTFNPDIIIYDEIHRYTSDVFQQVLELTVSKKKDRITGKLGLTATMPDKELRPKAFELLITNIGEVLYSYSLSDASKDRLLAPYTLLISEVGLTDSETKELGEIEKSIQNLKLKAKQTLEEKGIKFDVATILRQHMPQQYQIPEIFKLRNAYLKRRHLNFKARNKIYNASLTIQEILKENASTQIMVYTMTIETAERVHKELEQLEISSTTVHSQKNTIDNQTAVKRLYEKELSVLISVRTLDEGIDLPHLQFMIIIANSKQIRQMLQRIGRSLRIDRENPEKNSLIIIFEIQGDEFDIDSIAYGAQNLKYFPLDQLPQFYEELRKHLKN